MNVLSIDLDKRYTHVYTYLETDTRLEFKELFLFFCSRI